MNLWGGEYSFYLRVGVVGKASPLVNSKKGEAFIIFIEDGSPKSGGLSPMNMSLNSAKKSATQKSHAFNFANLKNTKQAKAQLTEQQCS